MQLHRHTSAEFFCLQKRPNLLGVALEKKKSHLA